VTAIFRLLATLALAAAPAPAGPADAGVAGPAPLRVVVVGSAPFVTKTTPPDGFAVQVWSAAAKRQGWTWQAVPLEAVDDALALLGKGEADVVVGPISITADRMKEVRFTQPWFHGSLAIAAAPRGPSAFERLRPLFAKAFLAAVGFLLVVLLLVGAAVWLFERRRNTQFPERAVPGIAAGLWFALVTMTTVGYGDKAPVTAGGKLVSGVWMLIAMVTASSLTAGIATGLTLSQIQRPALATVSQLEGKWVAVTDGSTGEEFAKEAGARTRAVASLDDAFALLDQDEVAAVVEDRPILSDYLRKHPHVDAVLSPSEYERRGYGFAVAPGSPLLEPLNVTLLELEEDGRVEAIRHRWLGP